MENPGLRRGDMCTTLSTAVEAQRRTPAVHKVWTAGVGGTVGGGAGASGARVRWGCDQRQRMVMMNPPMRSTKPMPRFQTPIAPMGYWYWLT